MTSELPTPRWLPAFVVVCGVIVLASGVATLATSDVIGGIGWAMAVAAVAMIAAGLSMGARRRR